MKCSNCGANLEPVEGKDISFCPYCGNKVEKPKYEPKNMAGAVHSIAQTAIKQMAETKKAEMEYEEKHRAEKRKDLHWALIAMAVLFFALLFLGDFLNR